MFNIDDTVYIPSELSNGVIINRVVSDGVKYEVKINNNGPFLFREEQLKRVSINEPT
jgi:hypothetical protein